MNLLITYPLPDHLLKTLHESNLFTEINYCPPEFLGHPSKIPHPGASWNWDPAYVAEDVLQRTTVCMTMFHVPRAPKLMLLQAMSAGIEHMYGELRGIPGQVCIASGVHSTCIAEYVVMHTLAHVHRLSRLQSIQQSMKWDRTRYVPPGKLNGTSEVRGMVLGVLGYGAIGREVARLGASLGMRIVAATRSGTATRHDGFTVDGTGDVDGVLPGKWYSSTNDLLAFLAVCDVLVISCPLTQSTKGIINEETLKSMKPDSLLINVARGQIIDQEALIDALETDRIGGAVLDVTDPEPLPPNHKLWSTENCTVTPHIAGASDMYEARCVDLLLLNVRRLNNGEDLINRVTFE